MREEKFGGAQFGANVVAINKYPLSTLLYGCFPLAVLPRRSNCETSRLHNISFGTVSAKPPEGRATVKNAAFIHFLLNGLFRVLPSPSANQITCTIMLARLIVCLETVRKSILRLGLAIAPFCARKRSPLCENTR